MSTQPRFAPTNTVPPTAGELLATLVQNTFLGAKPVRPVTRRRRPLDTVEVTIELEGIEIPVVVEYERQGNERPDGEPAPGTRAVAQALALADCAKDCAACKALAAKIPLDCPEIDAAMEALGTSGPADDDDEPDRD